MKTPFTRRHFLNLVGAAGGSTAVYQTSLALGLMQDTGPVATLDLKSVGGAKKKVAVLGAGIAGPHAGELIQTWILAVSKRMKIADIASMMAPYPTLGEISKRAAGSYYTPSLFGERTKKLIGFLRLFG